MTISFDFSQFAELLTLPMGEALWRIFFWYFGWLPVACMMLWGLLQVWLQERRIAWEHHQKFILLAIDIPRNNEQSLLAVENLFTYFAGAHNTFSLIEKWWEGKFQLAFSFEIVSIGGYIQFLIHTPATFRHLVESAVYSQYPDAEIYEVEDYAKPAPNEFPDDEYDIWGAEFIQSANEMLPIRTYKEFEHDVGKPEMKFRDPMASLMDLMSSLQKGEQLWYQILVVPIAWDWVLHADHYVDEILGKGHKSTKANDAVDKVVSWMSDASEQVYQLWGHVDDHNSKENQPLKAHELPPGPKKKLEAVQEKIAKMGFEVTIRAIYLAKKEVMNKPKVVNGFVGYIKQFNTGDLNALKPDTSLTMTSANYLFTKYRLNHKKNSIMKGYKHRSETIGRPTWIVNVEELATLWHFPIDAVIKAPLVQRASAKRIEPPMALPMDEGRKAASSVEPIFEEGFEVEEENAKRADPSFHAKPKTPGFLEEAEPSKQELEDERQEGEEGFSDPAGDGSPGLTNPALDIVPGDTAKELASDSEKKGSPPSNLPFG